MSSARYRYIDTSGREQELEDETGLLRAISEGRVKDDTMIHDLRASRWLKAVDMNLVAAPSGFTAQSMPQGESSKNNAAREPDLRGRFSSWLLVYSVGAWLAAALLQTISRTELGEDVASSIGYATGNGLVVAVLAFVLAKTSTLSRFRVAVWAVVGSVYALTSANSIASDRRMRADVALTASSVIQAEAGGQPISLAGVRDTTSLLFITTERNNAIENLFSSYQIKMKSAGARWLAPRQLATPKGRAETTQIVGDLRQSLTAIETGMPAINSVALGRMDALEARDELWRGAAWGFQRGSDRSTELVLQYVRVEQGVLSMADSIVDLIGRSQPFVSADGSELLFARTTDLTRYNTFIDSLKHLSALETTAVESVRASRRATIRTADSIRASIARP